MIQTSRRSFITGLISLAAAPAIVRASSLMPVKIMEPVGHIVEYWQDRKIYSNRFIRTYIDVRTIRDRNILLTPGFDDSCAVETTLFRGVPIVEFKDIDLSDPLWAMPK